MSLEHVLMAAGFVTAIGAAVALLWKWPIRPLIRFGRAIALFLEDWNGEPERPGVARRPGVMEQLATLHEKAKRTEWHVGNGNPVPLRQVVEAHGDEIRSIKEQLGITD